MREEYKKQSPYRDGEEDQTSANKEKDSRQSWIPLAISGLVIAAAVGLYFVIPSYEQFVDKTFDVLTSGEEQRISNYVNRFGFWGPFFIIIFMILQMFLLVVNVVAIMVVAVLAYGPVWGSLLSLAGVYIASTVGYFIGRSLGETAVDKLIGGKSKGKVEDKVNKYGFWAIIIARISPFLSNDAISFVAGLLRMNYLKFMLATIAGIVPLILFIAFLAEDINRLKTGLIWVSAISLAAFIGYVIYDWQKDKKKKKTENRQQLN